MALFDPYLNLAFDVGSYSLVLSPMHPSLDTDLRNGAITDITISNDREVLYSTDGGIVGRLSIDELTTETTPQITEIIAVAQMGEATDVGLPSANPGQLIEVWGENLYASVKLGFPVRDVGPPALRTDRPYSISPLHVSSDGNRAWYKVPPQAFSGVIRVDGDDQASGLPLQVVPLIGDKVLGLGIDDFELHIDGQPVNPCRDGNSSNDCSIRLSDEVLPVARESKRYVTAGGSAAVAAGEESSLDGDVWQLGELVSATATHGAKFAFEFNSENVVAAGSDLEFTVTASQGATAQPLPDSVRVEFVSEWPGGVHRYQLRGAFRIDDSSRYRVGMPVDFPGGQVFVQGADDTALDLQVAATVIAASGDSARRIGDLDCGRQSAGRRLHRRPSSGHRYGPLPVGRNRVGSVATRSTRRSDRGSATDRNGSFDRYAGPFEAMVVG